jgi:hypothetical protein
MDGIGEGDGGRVSWRIELWRQYSTHMATWYLPCIIYPGWLHTDAEISKVFFRSVFSGCGLDTLVFGLAVFCSVLLPKRNT